MTSKVQLWIKTDNGLVEVIPPRETDIVGEVVGVEYEYDINTCPKCGWYVEKGSACTCCWRVCK